MRLRSIAAAVAIIAVFGTFIQHLSEDEGRRIDFVPQSIVMTATATTTIEMTRPHP